MAEAASTAPAPAAPAPAAAVTAPPPPPIPKLPAGHRLYEAMWVIDSNLVREDYNKVVNALKEIVEKGGGAWINHDKWEADRKLAYPIKKKKRAQYIINHFSAPTDAVIKIDRNARLSEVVLRHMILVDEDGLITTPPVRTIEDEDFGFGGGFGGGGGGETRRFFNDRG